MTEHETEGRRPQSTDAPIVAGGLIARYVVLSRLGAGAMGVVFAAYDPELDRKVALKLLHPEDRSEGSDRPAHRRLLREAQAMAKLDHPNVVAVHDVGTHRGAIYVAMEFVDGMTLREWMKQPSMSLSTKVDLLVQAGRGLAAAHRRGLVHRDFKPDNVMVDRSDAEKMWRARVMDFGLVRAASVEDAPRFDLAIAEEGSVVDVGAAAEADAARRARDRIRERMAQLGRLGGEATHDGGAVLAAPDNAPSDEDSSENRRAPVRELQSDLTRTGSLMGTPAYMAPEQIRGETLDARTDQFSFCVTAWEVLFGERPFVGDTWMELFAAVESGRLQRAPTQVAVPARIRRALQRGLQTDPSARHPDMVALLGELQRDRAGLRRKVAVPVAGLAIAATVGIWWHDDAVCEGASQAIEQVWNEGRRHQIAATLISTGLPYASDAQGGVERELDEYAAAWMAMHEDACEATSVRGEQSEAALDLRMACLERGRTALRTLVETLERADAAVVERAVEAARRLPTVQLCGNLAALQEAVPPPQDPEVAKQVERARDRLARAETLESTGGFAAALRLCDEALDVAEQTAYRPLRAEVQLVRGRLLDASGDSASAAEALQQAADEARAVRHDRVAAAAEARLVYVVGYRLHDLQRGRWWAARARPAIERVEDDGRMQAELDNHEAVVLHAAGDSAAARIAFERALSVREAVLGEAHPDTIETLYNLGLVSRAAGQSDEALRLHRLALQRRVQTLGGQHPAVAESHNAIGVVLSQQGDLQRARAQFEHALVIQRAALGQRHPKIASTLNNLGNAAVRAGDLDAARRQLEQALEIYRESLGDDHPHVARARFNLGGVFVEQGDLDRAAAEYAAVVGIRERTLGDKHPQVGRVLASLGQTELDRGRIESARDALARALEILEADATGIDPHLVGRVEYLLAQALQRGGRRTDARSHARSARKRLVEVGAADRVGEIDAWLRALAAGPPG